MSIHIKNIDELNAEISRLTKLKTEQQVYLTSQYTLLRDKVQTPARVLGSLASNIPGVDVVKGLFDLGAKSKSDNHADWLTKVMRIGLPMLLNRTILRKAGWLKKTLVLLASERAAGQINKDKIGSAVSKIASFIRPNGKKNKLEEIDALEGKLDVNTYGAEPLEGKS